MSFRQIATLFLFLLLVVLYFRQEPLILEKTESGIHYRIEMSDSFSLFYFQCPELRWNVDGTEIFLLNGLSYDLEGSESNCTKQLEWQIGEQTVSMRRNLLMETAWGVLLLISFIWLLAGCFESPEPWDNLGVFSFLWGLTYVMHLINYPLIRTSFFIGTEHSIFPILLSGLVLAFPKKIFPLLLLALLQLIEYYVISPYPSNHTLVIAAINLMLLLAVAVLLLKNQMFRLNRQEFFRLFAPILRATALILYFWAWFHKLNSSFINPLESCAVEFYEETRVMLTFFPTGDWIYTGIINLTLIVEGLLPLLLIIPKTRLLAMLIGIGFHGFLGLTYFRDFTALMFLLYFSYISEEGLKRAKDLRPKFLGLAPKWLKELLLALIIFILLLALPGIYEVEFAFALGMFTNIFIVLIAGIVVAYLLYHQWFRNDDKLTNSVLHSASPLFWVIVPLLFINGAMPYIGLKTDNAFDMYSNMKTEQGSNHFIFPAYGQLFDYPNDLVEVVESSDPYFHNRDSLLVFWTFRERFYELQPDYVVIRRNGELLTVDQTNYAEVLGDPAPLLLYKFMLFQEVSTQCGL